MKNAPEIIYASRRCIDGFSQISLIEDLTWDEHDKVWFIHIGICNLDGTINIPQNTEWYITIPNQYPEGRIRIYPSVINGVTETFYHQANNGVISHNGLWRMGDPCLTDPFDDVLAVNKEPQNEDKLRWNILRLLQWIKQANEGTLVCDSDYFELPQLHHGSNFTFIFNEDEISFLEWESAEERSGIVTCRGKCTEQIFTDVFSASKNAICKKESWGEYVFEAESNIIGIWILLDKIPVINRWQAPNTYGELSLAFDNMGLDFKNELTPLLNRIRDGKQHPLFLGFPVPEKFNQEPVSYHWWTCVLPVLSYGQQYEKGFRCNNTGYIFRDFKRLLNKQAKIDWACSENWNNNQIMRRGQLSRQIISKKYIIIGAGSIGSAVAEQLIRSGVYNISIMDYDILKAGNLTRHTLTLESVGKSKATVLADHLRKINCHVYAKAINDELSDKNMGILNDYDVILDCTGDDDVFKSLSYIKSDKIVCSVSVGFKARRVYIFYSYNEAFSDEYLLVK